MWIFTLKLLWYSRTRSHPDTRSFTYILSEWKRVQRQPKMLMRQHGPSKHMGKTLRYLLLQRMHAYWNTHIVFRLVNSRYAYIFGTYVQHIPIFSKSCELKTRRKLLSTWTMQKLLSKVMLFSSFVLHTSFRSSFGLSKRRKIPFR